MSKWAPDNADGLHAYVITNHSWGKSHDSLEYAESLRDAKARFGWTRQLHARKSVRRATIEDIKGN